MFFFFFSSRRRHTRWNCDWSSDVCSSDLSEAARRSGTDAAHCEGTAQAMTREDVLAWLDSRRPSPPETLRRRIDRAINELLLPPSPLLPFNLAQVGQALLEGVAA